MISNNATNKRWHFASELETELAKLPHLNRIREAAALRSFFRNALFKKGYSAAQEWTHIVTLTSFGEEALKLCEFPNKDDQERADAAMAVFCLFFHHELLIDCEKSDLKQISDILNRETLSGDLRWPHRFGRSLYDKFNDNYTGDRTDHILPDEAWSLVDGGSHAVYQVDRFVTGPLGLIEGGHPRYIPPSRNVLLWHCSDPGCQVAHGVDLLQIEVPVVRCINQAHDALNSKLGPPSEWHRALADLMGRDVPREPFTYFDIITLIADCIVGVERTSLLATAFGGTSGLVLRNVLGSPPRKKNAGQGSPETLAASLNPEQQLQLLLLLKNTELVELVDKCVMQGSVQLPFSEIRSAKNRPPTANRIPTSELSSLGVRCSGSEPLLDFWALLWEGYSTSTKSNELDWRLRNRTGSATQNLLLDYISQNEPSVVVRDLVLASEPVTKFICEKLCCGLDGLSNPKFIDRLLWKLGFDLPRYSDTLALLRRRLEFFSKELLSIGELHAERDRERIRSAGVNLFVSVEEFLDCVVSYNVWLLASDHFIETRFCYDARAARQIVAKVLGTTIGTGEMTAKWIADKPNTLGISIAYLGETAKWMQSLPGSPRENLLRQETDLPHFATHKFRVFPFRHTAFWADCDYGSLEKLATTFASFASKVLRSNLAAIRNGLDHYRDESSFPKIDEMLAFVAHFREAIEIADVSRFFPKEFWIEKTEMDRFGRLVFVFKDYNHNLHSFFGPTFVNGIPGAKLDAPCLIAPNNLLGYANSEVVFQIRERSIFSDYWNGYPRRRQIPNSHKRFADMTVSQTQGVVEAPTTQ